VTGAKPVRYDLGDGDALSIVKSDDDG